MAGLFALLFLIFLIVLPISLIKPNIIPRFHTSRKKNVGIFGALTAASFVLTGITAPPPSQTKEQVVETIVTSAPSQMPVEKTEAGSKEIQEVTLTPTLEPTEVPTPTAKPTTKPTATPTIKINPTATPKPFIPTSTPVPTTSTFTAPPPSTGGYSCNCAKTCPQMASCAEAQYQLNVCGCGARDADNDGVACDSDCQ